MTKPERRRARRFSFPVARDPELFWLRTSVAGGFAVALMVLAFHTRMSWLYFRPGAADLADLMPSPGPFWAGAWVRHAVKLAAAAAFFLSLPGLGRRLLPARGGLSLFASVGAALVLWATAGFLLAAAGLSRPEVLRPLSAALVLAGLLKTPWRELRLTRQDLPAPFLTAALVLFAGFYLLTSLVPETFYDALVYHLAAPQAWLQAGRMTDMPDLHLWRLPGLLQPLYLWALSWSDDRLCKLLNLGFGFLTAGLMGRWAGDRWGKDAGAWAALLFLSSPMIGVNLWCCANDIPAGFFSFLALTLWLDSREKGGDLRPFLAGLFLGAGTAAKATALFSAPFFALAFASILRKDGKAALRPLGLFAAGFVLPVLPWWIRTGTWTGNPFFPQAADVFGGDSPANLALIKGWKADAAGQGGLFSRSLSLVRESLRGIEEGRFGFIGPSLLMLLPLAFFLEPDPLFAVLAGAAAASYAAYVSATGRLRYFIPHLPPLFILAAASFVQFADKVARLRHRVLWRMGPAMRWLAAAAALLNLVWLTLAFGRFNEGWKVVWGRQSAADYLREEHIGVYGHPSQAAFDWLKENDARGKLFVIGEARTFRSPIPARADGAFNVPRYAIWAGDPPSPDLLMERLKEEGFTYLLINIEEMKRLTPETYRNPEYLKVLGALFDRLAPPLYRDRLCILFKLP